MTSSALRVLAGIPSPSVGFFDIGPVRVYFWALCLIVGVVVATIMTNRRLTRRGAEPWVVIDIALIAVPLAIIGARVYHVLTHWSFYVGPGRDPLTALYVWQGGLAVFGALIGGAAGAYLGCRWTGIRFWSFADALAPGLLVAQALGRLGDYADGELFGLPTSVPWGLEIPSSDPAFPAGLADGTLFQPTFLYEMIGNLLGAAVLLWAGRRFRLQWGRLFGLYLVWYGVGRAVWESIRIDPSDVFLGLRTNVWAALVGVVVGIVILVVQKRRHTGDEPSPYRAGREWHPAGVVQSGATPQFVDVSAPPSDEAAPADATSAASASFSSVTVR